ncbi:MAG: DUF4271 domain-containing protein [Bacteroidota bacterium]
MNPIYRNIDATDWITLIFIAGLIIIWLAKYLFQSRFLNFIILPFNNKYLSLYNKKGKLLNWFHVFMSLFQLLNLSLFLFLAKQLLSENAKNNHVDTFLLLLTIVALYHLVKITLQLVKGYVFNTHNLVMELIYNKLSYLNYSSMILFLSNILLVYVWKDNLIIFYATFFLIALINGIGAFNILKNNQKLILANIFYFILYLCTLEIAPFVIIGSYLKQ